MEWNSVVCLHVKMTTLDLQINSIFIARAYTSIHSTRLISVLKRSCDASKAKTLVFVVNYQKKLGHKLYESKINFSWNTNTILCNSMRTFLYCFNAFLIDAQRINYYVGVFHCLIIFLSMFETRKHNFGKIILLKTQ